MGQGSSQQKPTQQEHDAVEKANAAQAQKRQLAEKGRMAKGSAQKAGFPTLELEGSEAGRLRVGWSFIRAGRRAGGQAGGRHTAGLEERQGYETEKGWAEVGGGRAGQGTAAS